MKSAPNYFEYFTQGESPFFDIEWIKKEDLSWIDELNKKKAYEKKERIKKDIEQGFNPDDCFDSDEEPVTKNFSSDDFPAWHEWPDEFHEKYKKSIEISNEKLAQIIKTAKQISKIDELTIYVDCEDGNHYFSTRYYANGDTTIATIYDDSDFDSVDTAVYAFINDYNEWKKDNGEAYEKVKLLSELEALHAPTSLNENPDCEHEDLGSLGYKYGTSVVCPYCGEIAEVW